MKETVIVLDFGGQYNQLIARRVRENHVYCEILPYTVPIERIKALDPKGIIFTGGPNSVYDPASPHYTPEVFALGIPVLGICYGCQLMAHALGGRVISAADDSVCEYGKTDTAYQTSCTIFREIPANGVSWMSHRDYISEVPDGFSVTATTAHCPVAAMANEEKKLYGVQFHPEVNHTDHGSDMLRSFLFDVCGCKGEWQMDSFIDDTVAAIKAQVGDKGVVLGLSGGVDSSVAAALLSRAVGKQLTCVFVDQGLMRKDEGDYVENTFTKLFDMNFVRINCQEEFLSKLKGVSDPEEKRNIIGTEFYNVFWNRIRDSYGSGFFAQGTIYPDRIESGKGDAAKIKTHHN
ncbi:MAG: glutamine-hydrolyzing GMP synthase, partial [Ruminococcus sp.]|nr:glutamine-hydrolyzing GMP synthase [Ruminococcus sp.]